MIDATAEQCFLQLLLKPRFIDFQERPMYVFTPSLPLAYDNCVPVRLFMRVISVFLCSALFMFIRAFTLNEKKV